MNATEHNLLNITNKSTDSILDTQATIELLIKRIEALEQEVELLKKFYPIPYGES